MKAIFAILIVLISTAISYSQNDISIKLLENPSNALSDSEHFYLIDLKNNSNTQFKNLNISVKSVSCNNDSKDKLYKNYSNTDHDSKENKNHKDGHSHSNLHITILEKDKTTTIHNLNLDGKISTVFYVKYSKSKSTKLNTANCFKIVVKSSDNEKELSNGLTIEQLIPDPNNFD